MLYIKSDFRKSRKSYFGEYLPKHAKSRIFYQATNKKMKFSFFWYVLRWHSMSTAARYRFSVLAASPISANSRDWPPCRPFKRRYVIQQKIWVRMSLMVCSSKRSHFEPLCTRSRQQVVWRGQKARCRSGKSVGLWLVSEASSVELSILWKRMPQAAWHRW